MTPMGSIIALNRKTQSTFGWGSRGQNPGGGGGGSKVNVQEGSVKGLFLTLHILISVCIFSILVIVHLLRC